MYLSIDLPSSEFTWTLIFQPPGSASMLIGGMVSSYGWNLIPKSPIDRQATQSVVSVCFHRQIPRAQVALRHARKIPLMMIHGFFRLKPWIWYVYIYILMDIYIYTYGYYIYNIIYIYIYNCIHTHKITYTWLRQRFFQSAFFKIQNPHLRAVGLLRLEASSPGHAEMKNIRDIMGI